MGAYRVGIASGTRLRTDAHIAKGIEEQIPHGSLFARKNCQEVILRADSRNRAIEDLSEAVQARNEILTQLLPSIDFDNFPGLSKEKIENLLSSEKDCSPPATSQQSEGDVAHPSGIDSIPGTLSDSEHEWNESRGQDYTSPIGDDVDGLASQEKHGSYLGISSISAALRLIFFSCPATKHKFAELSRSFPQRGHHLTFPARPRGTQLETLTQPETSAPFVPEQIAVDAYFEHLHGTNAMIDEEGFRKSFKDQDRTDDAWIALLNMVLALGSIAAGEDNSHAFYYSRAQRVIGYNTFGTGNLEMLQALILLGGGYLHYINSPNTAYLIMGMAFRMAIAMALHREPTKGPHLERHHLGDSPSSIPSISRLPRAEIRRRTWWTLVYTDSTGGLSLGRPPTGRWDPATMDCALPSDQPLLDGPCSYLATSCDAQEKTDCTGTALRVCGEFAKLCSRVEYRMAQFSRMTAKEILSFETQIQAWEKNCPQIFKPGSACPRRIRLCRDVLQYRLLATRIVLSRPHIFRLIEDGTASSTFGSDDWRVVSICQEAASGIINAASANPGGSRIAVWHCSWYLFQACMIPLLSLTLTGGSLNLQYFSSETVAAWMESLERALRTFKEMEPYKRPSDRYGNVIEALYSGVIADRSPKREAVPIFDTSMLSEMGTPIFDVHDIPPMEAFQDWFDTDLVFGDGDFNWHLFPEEHMSSFP